MAKQQYDRETIIQEIARLAFSDATDAVALAFLPVGSDIKGMNVAMVTEAKVGEKGGGQVKLIDRVELIRLLVELIGTGNSENLRAQSFFEALDTAAKQMQGEET